MATEPARDQRLGVTPLPTTRQRVPRFPAGLKLATALGLLAALGILVLTKGTEGVPVAVAARPLVAGEAVREADLRYVDVAASETVTGTLLRAGDIEGLAGRPAARSIPEGSLLTRQDLGAADEVAQQRAMSIPIEESHAVGGRLNRGDAVDVIDSSGATPVYVVTNARVLEAGGGESRISAGSKYAVTITVDDASALRLAAAIANDKVDIVRSTGATTATGAPTTTAVRR